LAPFFVAAAVFGPVRTDSSNPGWAACGFVALIFAGFIGWRVTRMLRARALKEGRFYERKARYALPPEYRNSEDALVARRRGAKHG
jgi:hypothetical protein